MLETKAGELAGAIWTALNEKESLNLKELKKAAKIKADKDLYLGLGWLLREGKLEVKEVEEELVINLK